MNESEGCCQYCLYEEYEVSVLDRYEKGQISLGKVAELLGLPSRREVLPVLKKHGVNLNLRSEEVDRDVDVMLGIEDE